MRVLLSFFFLVAFVTASDTQVERLAKMFESFENTEDIPVRRMLAEGSNCIQVGLYLGLDLEDEFGDFNSQVKYFKGMFEDISDLYYSTWGIRLQLKKAWQRDWGLGKRQKHTDDNYFLFEETDTALEAIVQYFTEGAYGDLQDVNIIIAVTSWGGVESEGIAGLGGLYTGRKDENWGDQFGLMVGVTNKGATTYVGRSERNPNTLLFAHEIGHILGASHTHDTSKTDETVSWGDRPLDWCGVQANEEYGFKYSANDERCDKSQYIKCDWGTLCGPGCAASGRGTMTDTQCKSRFTTSKCHDGSGNAVPNTNRPKSYVVDWDDGDRKDRTKTWHQLRLRNGRDVTELNVGDRVQAKFRDFPDWYNAKIAQVREGSWTFDACTGADGTFIGKETRAACEPDGECKFTPGELGTIMSYCDMCGDEGGAKWEFHPEVKKQVEAQLKKAWVNKDLQCQNCRCLMECEEREGVYGICHSLQKTCDSVTDAYEERVGKLKQWVHKIDREIMENEFSHKDTLDDNKLGVYCFDA